MTMGRHLVAALLILMHYNIKVAATEEFQDRYATRVLSVVGLQVSIPWWPEQNELRGKKQKQAASATLSKQGTDWKNSKETRKNLEEFHLQRARVRKDILDDAKLLETTILMQIRDQMKKMSGFKVKEFQYTGSIYEGLKVGNPNDFDIMVIIDAYDLIDTPTSYPGYFQLVPTGDAVDRYKKSTVDDNVSSSKILDAFFGFVVKTLQALEMYKEAKPRRHGPAVQVKIQNKDIKFSIDVVPTFVARSGELYVAKGPSSDRHLWRRSTSLKEKETLKNIDKGNGIRRMCVRILKAIKEKEPTFQILQSYHFKTALLHLNKEKLSWTALDLGPRVFDLLTFIRGCLEQKRMSHFFLPEMNILEDKNYNALIARIQRLTNSQEEFYKLIQV